MSEFNCTNTLVDNAFNKKLISTMGNDVRLIAEISLTVTTERGFNPSFVVWCSDNKKALNPEKDFENPTDKVIELCKEFYYKDKLSVGYTQKQNPNNSAIDRFGYTDVITRERSKEFSANFILDKFINDSKEGKKKPNNLAEYYKNEVKNVWLNTLIKYAISDIENADINTYLSQYNAADDKAAFIDKLLGGKNKTTTAANYFAIYNELFGSDDTATFYIYETFNDPKLASVVHEASRDLESEIARLKKDESDAASDTELDGVPSEEGDNDMDTYIEQANSHMGVFTNFMSHVGERIRNYFNTLRQQNTTNEHDLKTDDVFGIALTMDANACSSMIYNNWRYNNPEEMIAGIRRIAETVAGFEAFYKFANDLEANADLAAEVFRTYARTRIRAQEVNVQNGEATVKVSNSSSNPGDKLRFLFMNDARTSALSNDRKVVSEKLAWIKTTVSNAKAAAKRKIKLTNEMSLQLDTAMDQLAMLVKTYYPSAQLSAIKSYLLNNGTKNKLDNALLLVEVMDDTVKTSAVVEDEYNRMQTIAAGVKERNKIRKAYKDKVNYVPSEEFEDLKEVYTIDYGKPIEKHAMNLANMLLPYSIVDTDLNYSNIHGNNNSAIINNSMSTAIIKLLATATITENNEYRSETLEKWALNRYNTPQYRRSSLLFKQTYINDKGEEVDCENVHLFDVTHVKGLPGQPDNIKITINNDGIKAFKMSLFNGASNLDSSTNSAYTEMTMGDYLPTSYMQFFKTTDVATSTSVATYFMRTPADAPKIFTFQGVRYDTRDLFRINDPNFSNKINTLIEDYANVFTDDNHKSVLSKVKGIEVPVKFISSYLFPTERIEIRKEFEKYIKPVNKEETENDVYRALVPFYYTYTRNGEKKHVGFLMEGDITKYSKGFNLNNAVYRGCIEFDITDKGLVYNDFDTQKIPTHIEEALRAKFTNSLSYEDVPLRNGDIVKKATYAINTNHRVFHLIKNQFIQELIDAGVALEHYFELKQLKNGNYVVALEKSKNGAPKPKYKKNVDHTKGYKFYHVKGNDVLSESTDKDGNTFYELKGEVFHSNKFTLDVMNEKGIVENINYLDQIITTNINTDDNFINLFYGGMEFKADTNSDGDIVITDVVLTDAQNALVDQKLSEFMNAYKDFNNEAINNYKDFIQGVEVNDANVTEIAFNQLLMLYEFDNIFEGSPKFYKDAQTLFKRAKESQGSGVPYGTIDYNSIDDYSLDDVTCNSFLNNGTTIEYEKDANGRFVKNEDGTYKTHDISVQDLFNKYELLRGIRQRKGFKGCTIANTEKTNTPALNRLVKQLSNQLKKQGFTEDAAVDHAETILFGPKEDGKRRGGFTDTKVNDAQSYITFQEWVRRIASRGQLQKYLPLILKLADENQKVTPQDINEFVQVQKNYYYDLYKDARYGIFVPRQIKNAEFVLVPKFIKGTELERVYDLMVKNEIDQLNTVETSKAANERILTLWNEDGVLTDENIDNFNKNVCDAVQLYTYNNLYTQQETPQHMNAENKAGIQIMKKIIDNLPDTGKLGKLKTKFFKLFCSNIQTAAEKVFRDFEIPTDENGNILLDENGNIKGINLEVFYSKLKDELVRTGIDSNMIDYVTLDENGFPRMPAEMNNILSKFESVVQSVFNNAITRQKLPGFHAAQVTNVGFQSFGFSKEKIKKDSEYPNTHPLRYHPEIKGKTQSFIEIRLPMSYLGIDKNSRHYKNMTKEQILKELQTKELDTLIGYRIPTEGKQSVCIMKIVDLLDSDMGSTIIVPDDWVSQTGSDFDIDSVYGINFATRKLKNGEIVKEQYREKLTNTDWFRLIYNAVNKSNIETNASDVIKKAFEKLKDVINSQAEFEDAMTEEKEAWGALPDDIQQLLKKTQKQIRENVIKEGFTDKNEIFYESLRRLSVFVKAKAPKLPAYKVLLDNFVDKIQAVMNIVDDQSEEYAIRKWNAFEDYYNKHKKEIRSLCDTLSIPTLEDYIDEENVYKNNTYEGRCNEILQTMMDILDDAVSLEENLSRSNFDRVSDSKRKIMSKNATTRRKARSPYNWIHQALYQEDAMSGAKLKAISVTLDTLCSVGNVTKAMLGNKSDDGIYIVYDSTIYDAKQCMDRFDTRDKSDSNVWSNPDAKIFSIKHRHYGWSNDNRNMEAYILTAYSSQTTAYILDAVKEGSLPNVNDYTFKAFKTLPNMGVDYKTALGFIMQPAITEVVNAYNSTKSVYANNTGNAIEIALKKVASTLVEVNSTDDVHTVLNKVQALYGEQFNKIFKVDPNAEDLNIVLNAQSNKRIPILSNETINRINDAGIFSSNTPVEKMHGLTSDQYKALFDIGNILVFNRLFTIAKEIGEIGRCCNPDKFGAKQTVYSTRKVFESIDRCIYNVVDKQYNDDKRDVVEKRRKSATLQVNGKHLLEAIYPGIDNETASVDDIIINASQANNIDDSAYRSLFAFLKYASATSAIVAKRVFNTQDQAFVKLVSGIKTMFSGYNLDLSEDTYKSVQKYILSDIYNRCPAIKYPVTFTKKKSGWVMTKADDMTAKARKEYFDIEDLEESAEAERYRIYGYDRNSDVSIPIEETYTEIVDGQEITKKRMIFKPFECIDVNNPTKEELINFNKLSPAQKVKWIQTKAVDPAVFGLLEVNLFNDKKRGKWCNMQTIEYTEQHLHPNIVYYEFKRAFENANPLIVSAAIDLVKYAVQVEGLNMSFKAINKVIDNDCLLNAFGENGLGFVDHLNQQMMDIKSNSGVYSEKAFVEDLYEKYFRSHLNIDNIRNIWLSDKNIKNYNINTTFGYGMLSIRKTITPDNKRTEDTDDDKAFDNMCVSMSLKSKYGKTIVTNSYIKITKPKYKTVDKKSDITRLYKIIDLGDEIILVPLPTLNANENTKWSVNESNNQGVIDTDVAMKAISDYSKDKINNAIQSNYITQKITELKEKGPIWYKRHKSYHTLMPAKDFDIYKINSGTALMSIEKYVNDFYTIKDTESLLYVNSMPMTEYITAPGVGFGSVQDIKYDVKGVDEDGLLDYKTAKVAIYKPTNIKALEDDYLSARNKTKDLPNNLNKSLADIITTLRSNNTKYLSNLYAVAVINENSNDVGTASLFSNPDIDLYGDTRSYASSRLARNEGKNELSYVGAMNANLQQNELSDEVVDDIILLRHTAKYVNDRADELSLEFNTKFLHIPDDDSWVGINNPKVLAACKKDAILRQKYVTLCNEVKAFINTFGHYNAINVESDNEEIKIYLKKLKDAIAKVQRLAVDDAFRNYCDFILVNYSTNPLVKDGFINAMDLYWKSYGGLWRFNDIMENQNPLLQVMLKDVMDDIETKRQAFEIVKTHYRSAINAIMKDAEANGTPVDLSHIINDNGTFVEAFSQQFIDDLQTLQNDMRNAITETHYGSVKHLQALHDLNVFKQKYVNQELVDEYYEQSNKLEGALLKYYPKRYSRYVTIKRLQRQLLENKSLKDKFTEFENALYNSYQDELNALLSGVDYNLARMTRLKLEQKYAEEKKRRLETMNGSNNETVDESIAYEYDDYYEHDVDPDDDEFVEYEEEILEEEDIKRIFEERKLNYEKVKNNVINKSKIFLKILKDIKSDKKAYDDLTKALNNNSTKFKSDSINQYLDNWINNYSDITDEEREVFRSNIVYSIQNKIPTAQILQSLMIELLKKESKVLTDSEIDSIVNTDDFFKALTEAKGVIGPINAIAAKLTDKTASKFFRTLIDAKKELDNKYYTFDENEEFQQLVKEYRNYVLLCEKRDEYGKPTVSKAILDKNEKYVEAINWLKINAERIYNVKAALDFGESDEIYAKTILGKPIKNVFEFIKNISDVQRYMGYTRNITPFEYYNVYNKYKMLNGTSESIYDSEGVMDGTKLTDADRAKLKELQLSRYYKRPIGKTTAETRWADKALISNGGNSGYTYSNEFYSKLRKNGITNKEYFQYVTAINAILSKYLDSSDNLVHFERMSDTEESIKELNTLATLYTRLQNANAFEIYKYEIESSNNKEANAFIENNVEFVINKDNFHMQNVATSNFSKEFKLAYAKVVFAHEADGAIKKDKNGNYAINSMLFGYLKPKGEPGTLEHDRWIDKNATYYNKMVESVFVKTPTKYYDMAEVEAQSKGCEYYKQWYEDNHVYNPNTKKKELLDCWVTKRINTKILSDHIVPDANGNSDLYTYEPTYRQKSRIVNPEYENKKHKKGTLYENYKTDNTDTKYHNTNTNVTEQELRLKDYLKKVLMSTAKTNSAKRYFEQNKLPQDILPAETTWKTGLKEAGKLFGIGIAEHNGMEKWYREIGYEHDHTPTMPMLKDIKNKRITDWERELEQHKNKSIELEMFDGDVNAYNEAVAENEKAIKDLQNNIDKEHTAILNKDWLTVIESYLERANNYNAVLDNKQNLYFLHYYLRETKMFNRDKGVYGDLELEDDVKQDPKNPKYAKSIDKDLIEQYEVFLRRILFNQYKEKEGNLTNVANMLQGFASANYMMMNLKGGFANVTLGETAIIAEAAAGEYFNAKEWLAGTNEWRKGSLGFGRSTYDMLFHGAETAYNKQTAIINHFKVVDYDEIAGVPREADFQTVAKRIRDSMFAPQTIGEHFMQNSVLFAMLKSHKIIMDGDTPRFMTKREYVDTRLADELSTLLTEEQLRNYNEFKEKLKSDKNKIKDYVWLRRNALTDWVYLHTNKEQIDNYIKLKEEKEAEFGKEFESKESLFDQLDMDASGKLTFVKDSELAKLNEELADVVGGEFINEKGEKVNVVTKANQLLGAFDEKVKKVNNRIHGVYNKLGAASLESKWYGSLVMQYHKHLPMGLIKRYLARGYYNETRHTNEKGLVQSMIDVTALNIEKLKQEYGLSEEEESATKSFIAMLTMTYHFIGQMSTTLKVIPSYERANLARNIGDAGGTTLALLATAGLWAYAGDDDDKQGGFMFNAMLYQADRLASECFMYNPYGLFVEGKKLMSTPIAAQSVVSDALNAFGLILDWMTTDGDDYEYYYETGRFAGQSKLSVYVQRRIPIWSAIRSIMDTASNNQYYKLGRNPIGLINIKNLVVGSDD